MKNPLQHKASTKGLSAHEIPAQPSGDHSGAFSFGPGYPIGDCGAGLMLERVFHNGFPPQWGLYLAAGESDHCALLGRGDLVL